MSMPMVKRQWTFADLEDLPDDGNRYEIIDGELFVTPAPSLNHQDAVIRLHRQLADYLSVQRVGYAYVSPADIVFTPRRAVQPDVFVVPLVGTKRPRHFDEVRRLLVAAEVLSPTTARADRVRKRALFRDEGVAEYWIVDLESRTFERSTPADARVDVIDDELHWSPAGATTPMVIDVAAFFAALLDD
jgi:Uma2 family endonuclease